MVKVRVKFPLVAGRKYFTEEGNEVRIYATDGAPGEEVHGAVKINGRWYSNTFGTRGSSYKILHGQDIAYEEWEPLRFEPVLARAHEGALPGIRFYWKDSYCYHHGMERAKEGEVARWKIIEPFIGDLPRDVAKMRDELICARSGYEK